MAVSIGEPIGLAMSRTGRVLFKPFRFSKWLALAVGAWLTLVGEGGFGFGFPGGGSGPGPGGPAGGGGGWADFADWLQKYLWVIIAVAVAAAIVLTCIYLLARWLNSRGQFMFFDSIVCNEARVKEAWGEFRELGNSLFKFRLMWDLILANLLLLLLIITGALAYPDIKRGIIEGTYPFTGWTIGAILFFGCSLPVFVAFWWLARSFIFELMVPVMYVRRIKAKAALRETWSGLFRPNFGTCLLYFLFMIVVGIVEAMWAGMAGLVLAIVTCCAGYVLILIPIVGSYVIALIALPPMTFTRAYVLFFIEQFGSEYRVVWREPVGGGFPVIVDEAGQGGTEGPGSGVGGV